MKKETVPSKLISSIYRRGPDKEYVDPQIAFNIAEVRDVTPKLLMQRLKRTESRLEMLFVNPIKFKFPKLNITKLETLYLSLHQGPVDIIRLDEKKRMQLFKRLIRELKARRLSLEEVKKLRIALGYPAKQQSKFQRHVKEAVQQLIDDLKKDIRKLS